MRVTRARRAPAGSVTLGQFAGKGPGDRDDPAAHLGEPIAVCVDASDAERRRDIRPGRGLGRAGAARPTGGRPRLRGRTAEIGGRQVEVLNRHHFEFAEPDRLDLRDDHGRITDEHDRQPRRVEVAPRDPLQVVHGDCAHPFADRLEILDVQLVEQHVEDLGGDRARRLDRQREVPCQVRLRVLELEGVDPLALEAPAPRPPPRATLRRSHRIGCRFRPRSRRPARAPACRPTPRRSARARSAARAAAGWHPRRPARGRRGRVPRSPGACAESRGCPAESRSERRPAGRRRPRAGWATAARSGAPPARRGAATIRARARPARRRRRPSRRRRRRGWRCSGRTTSCGTPTTSSRVMASSESGVPVPGRPYGWNPQIKRSTTAPATNSGSW